MRLPKWQTGVLLIVLQSVSTLQEMKEPSSSVKLLIDEGVDDQTDTIQADSLTQTKNEFNDKDLIENGKGTVLKDYTIRYEILKNYLFYNQ